MIPSPESPKAPARHNFDNFWAEYGSGVMAAYPAHEAANIRDLCRNSWMACIAMAPELPAPTPAAQGGDTREAVAKIVAAESLDADLEASWRAWCPEDQGYFLAQADKILSLIHPSLTDAGVINAALELTRAWYAGKRIGDEYLAAIYRASVAHDPSVKHPQPQHPGEAK